MAPEPIGTAADTQAPPTDTPSDSPAKQSNGTSPTAKRHEEYQYLDLVEEILDYGEHRPDRTGTGTYSIFAPRPLKFSLHDPATGEAVLPLLTTKRVFLKAVVAELLWFVAGGTSSAPLSEQGVRIWDGNGSRAFLDSVGLGHRAEGDLGPVYGFQWRHFGAEYVDAGTDYTGRGVDQLADVVRKLRTTPYDRRIVLSAWNPADLPKMALPPCHMFAQFYVSYPRRAPRRGGRGRRGSGQESSEPETSSSQQPKQEEGQGEEEKGHLHCQLYQRSCDMGLGVPFNIASYALLTHMVAHACGLVPGSLTHVMGDAHVYRDHVGALREQLGRAPRAFPTLEIAGARAGRAGDGVVDGWAPADFVVKGYDPHKSIAMKMSV
ncbi:Thymidylate synthase [Diatrype stigma]|uniref:thymidylate synthase n=1 Tax=Diatrype stigma TaxID=117547 RepID=A0AAN9V904_9PEZI